MISLRSLLGVAGLGFSTAMVVAQSPPSPYPMPGTVVGRPALSPVGTPFPKAAPAAGTPIGYSGQNGQPVNVGQRPAGQLINLNNLAAPLVAPLPTELTGARPKSSLELLFDKWKAGLGFGPPAQTPPVMWTPGLSRRNKERRETKTAWQRD